MTKKMKLKRIAGLIGVLAGSGALGHQCLAADARHMGGRDPGAVDSRMQIEEIVVTAQKREERAQDVPISIATVSGETLEKAGISDLSDIQRVAPSTGINPFPTTSTTFTVFMRGVGEVDAEQPTRDLGVGIYIDDVYVARAQGLATEMADLERIEVLRGPQGTLYGRNTIGGAIKFITAKPKGRWAFKESLDVATGGHFKSLTSLDLPTMGNLAAKVTYLRKSRDGLVKNSGAGGDFGEQDGQALRLALRWTPVDDVTVDYVYDRARQDGTPNYQQRLSYVSARPFGVTVPLNDQRLDSVVRPIDNPLADNYSSQGHALTVQWDLTPKLSLKSITSHRKLNADRLQDATDAFALSSIQFGNQNITELSQEFTLSGLLDSPKLNYVVGANYYRGKGEYFTNSSFRVLPTVGGQIQSLTMASAGPGTLANFENASKGAYVQATWVPRLMENRWSLTAGTRYSQDTRIVQRTRFTSPPNYLDAGPVIATSSSVDPAFTVDYKWTDDLHTYLRVAKAYRAGGWAVRNPAGDPAVQPEHLLSREFGLKSQWWDNRMQFNIALYESKYSDMQITYTGADLVGHIENAGRASIRGVEIDAALVPMPGLTLTGSYAYTTGHPDGPFVATISPPTTGINLFLPFIARDKLNLAGEYTFAPLEVGTLSARLDYAYTAKQRDNGAAVDYQPAYTLLNGRLTLGDIKAGDGRLSASLYANNLTDKKYIAYVNGGVAVFGERRVVGINLTYKY